MKNIDEKIKVASSYLTSLICLKHAQEGLCDAEEEYDINYYRKSIKNYENECAVKLKSIIEMNMGNARPITPPMSANAAQEFIKEKTEA
jgi:DUF2075 family protein